MLPAELNVITNSPKHSDSKANLCSVCCLARKMSFCRASKDKIGSKACSFRQSINQCSFNDSVWSCCCGFSASQNTCWSCRLNRLISLSACELFWHTTNIDDPMLLFFDNDNFCNCMPELVMCCCNSFNMSMYSGLISRSLST